AAAPARLGRGRGAGPTPTPTRAPETPNPNHEKKMRPRRIPPPASLSLPASVGATRAGYVVLALRTRRLPSFPLRPNVSAGRPPPLRMCFPAARVCASRHNPPVTRVTKVVESIPNAIGSSRTCQPCPPKPCPRHPKPPCRLATHTQP